jgi:predicted ribosome quality control (RQC) complex YloA/Tae2 family protein
MDEAGNLVAAATGRRQTTDLDRLGIAESAAAWNCFPHSDQTFRDQSPGQPDADAGGESVEELFGSGGMFGPGLKDEFEARRNEGSTGAALSSLRDDLASSPIPLVFSALPLEEFGSRPVDLKTDLLLSHIELDRTRGLLRNKFASLSDAADAYYAARRRAIRFHEQLAQLAGRTKSEIERTETSLEAARRDYARFKDPDKLKRLGDLLLSNLATAKTSGEEALVIDHFDPDQARVAIDLGGHKTLQEAAAMYYGLYQKARRSLSTIESRIGMLGERSAALKKLLNTIEANPTRESLETASADLDKLFPKRAASRAERKQDRGDKPQPGRRFVSSDGYDILVGRNDNENDAITFKVARSGDIWMHAADYPGSHVLVRNPKRQNVPARTIAEAAGLAAFYSQAKKELKAGVHYTEKKYVSKPPRARPGLVRLSSYKTILVAPKRDIGD